MSHLRNATNRPSGATGAGYRPYRNTGLQS